MAPHMNANNVVNSVNTFSGSNVGVVSGGMGMNQPKNPPPSNKPFSINLAILCSTLKNSL
jgi:hypothetical protein